MAIASSGSENLESRDRMGGRDDEEGRPRQRAHRESDGAALGARRRERCDYRSAASIRWRCSVLAAASATPPHGIEADVLVVKTFDELTQRAADAKGKIVLFNAAYVSYGQTNQYRTGRTSRGRACGAVAALVRAIGPTGPAHAAHRRHELRRGRDQDSRGGDQREDAERIQRIVDRGRRVRVRLADGSAVRGRTSSRRTSSARFAAASCPTKSCSSAATSIRGMSAPARRTTASAAS